MSLNLPENYELVAGTKWENVHLYYDLFKVSMLGNAHGVNVLMTISLKTASQHFTLHKLIVLPTRISENKLIEYVHDFAYLTLSFNQRDFPFLKEADLQLCSAGSLTVCSINVALYDAKVAVCEADLFIFQTSENPCYFIIAPLQCIGTAPRGFSTIQSSVRSLYAVHMDPSI